MSTTTAQADTTRTIVFALAVNLGITITKAVAGVLTGSAAMLTEAAHSFIDMATEIFLIIGQWHGRRWPKGVYLWGAVAAASMFLIGGVYGLYSGVTTMFSDDTDTWPWVALAVLVVSAAMETSSWRNAFTTLAAQRDGKSWLQHLRTTTNTAAKTVLVEDTADIGGDLLAIVGIGLGVATGSPLWDGLASAVIGLLLTGMAFDLGKTNIALLTR